AAADIIGDRGIGTGAFAMSAYPASQPVFTALIGNGVITKLLSSGVTVRSAFCGPCFGAGDVPSNGAFSIRHTTRNFPNREGSKPGNGQSAYVALMDARSIAATAANGGKLTSALGAETSEYTYTFDDSAYKNRFYNGFGNPDKNAELVFGPNITDWPAMPKLGKNLLVKLASVIDDPVTTTDELIPSGETSSYRSNPLGLAEFTLSRKDPEYVGRAKTAVSKPVGDTVLSAVRGIDLERTGHDSEPDIQIGSAVYAVKPGDGSAREQAASCQRVLGGLCNIAREYATKRYRSNLINWGMLPLLYDNDSHTIPFTVDDYLYVPEIRSIVENGTVSFDGYIIHKDGNSEKIVLGLAPLTDDEKKIILAGCLINFYHDGL
ncbi:MAG: aconitase family protein, partial [Clostridia bacterium]|nr:aconitase family protein [Clostridia bacterium]